MQGMVARFNSLDIKDYREIAGEGSPTSSPKKMKEAIAAAKRDEVALKRSEMAREMAELELGKMRREWEEQEHELRRLKEEFRRQKRDVEEGRDRERKTMKRLEVLMVSLSHLSQY